MTKVLLTMGRRYGFRKVTREDSPVKNQLWTIDSEAVDTFMLAIHVRFNLDDPVVFIHGCAPGEDMLVSRVLPLTTYWSEERYPADWDTFRKAAGPIRNRQMLEQGKPDICLAFPGSTGTEHMKSLCRKAGIPVEEIE